MVLPLLMLAAGILAQKEGERRSVEAQQGELRHESQAQQGFRAQAGQQVQRNINANTVDNRLAENRAGADRLTAANATADNNALKLFEGAGGNAGVADAQGAVAAKRSVAGADLAAPGLGNQARRRLSMDVASNVEGIRQRSQRSLGLLPGKLDYAATKGQDLNTAGQLLAAYGYGGTASMLSGMASSNAAAQAAPATTPSQPYTTQSPGAADLWGDNAAAAVA